MKFFELAVGDKFLYNDIEHIKVKEERVSCCKVGCNAKLTNDPNSKIVIKPLENITKVDPPAQDQPA